MNDIFQNSTEGILFTDQYQLTMAQVYFRQNVHEQQVQFDHFFREYPDYGEHQAGYCINAGLEWLTKWMRQARFGKTEIETLKNQKTRTGNSLFRDDFLNWLEKHGSFDQISISAIPEGRVVHPNEPLTVVRGPVLMAQILETALLNQLNYQILVATKAARIRHAAHNQAVLEFGARRGQDKGAVPGARAALIGGANFTSNVGISQVLGYPPKGTHAHSMVQMFLTMGMSELETFRAFAELYPDDCILLVDTIDTLENGIPNAIQVFEELRRKGHHPVGIRLDSGDLAYLSIQAAKMLNAAGFKETVIVLSNELDELRIWQIIDQVTKEAPKHSLDSDSLIKRFVFGVGTRLITSHGAPALGGVYKLVAVNDQNSWKPAIKVSETIEKIPNPGKKNVFRIYDQRGKATADLLSPEDEYPMNHQVIVLRHPTDSNKYRSLKQNEISGTEPLLIEVMNEGKLCYEFPSIDSIRKVRDKDLDRLDEGVKRLINPHIYHVSITQTLWDLKKSLITSMRHD